MEWLEADGAGGFASGTASGERTRRYHALLLHAATPPTGRVVLVNGVEAWVESGAVRTPITTQRYTPDILFPDIAKRITSFSHNPWPSWTFTLEDGTTLRHDIVVEPDSCKTCLHWQHESGTTPCRLMVRLLLSGRDYHALHRENPYFASITRSAAAMSPGIPTPTCRRSPH